MKRRRVARVFVVGMPGAGRTTLCAQLVAAAVRERIATLVPLANELALRGLHREDLEARRGSRTTRQILDAVLRDGRLDPGAPEDESLFLASPLGVLEIVDVAGARFANDALHDDPLHPFREIEKEAAKVLLVLDAARWAGPDVREAELDRAAALLGRLEAAGRARGRAMPEIVFTRANAPDLVEDTRMPAGLECLFARLSAPAGVGVWTLASDDPELIPLARGVLGVVAPRARPRSRLALLALGSLGALGFVLGAAWQLRGVAGEPRLGTLAEERAFIERGERSLRLWSWAPGGGAARRGIEAHARFLEEDLAAHPAVAEPASGMNLQAAQYRAAAADVELAARILGAGPAREALAARLREKARVAEMPLCTVETLAAWEELWRTTADPALRDGAIAPRIRAALVFLVDDAEREAGALETYPEILRPLLKLEAEHAPLAADLVRGPKAKQWDRALSLVACRVLAFAQHAGGDPKAAPPGDPGAEKVETLLAALAAAPEPPPDSFLASAGRLMGGAVLAAQKTAPDAAARCERLLGPAGAQGLATVIPAAYEDVVHAPRESGPDRLRALRRLLAHLPRDLLVAPMRARTAALDAHLAALDAERTYSLTIVRAWVGSELESWKPWRTFDLTVAASAERAPERVLGPFWKVLDRRFDEPILKDFPWRAWESVDVRVTDAGRPVGLSRHNRGTCFGLHDLVGDWKDPTGHGGMTVAVDPEPPAPFDFAGWLD